MKPTKNVTIALPVDLYRELRVRAAKEGRSLSSSIRERLDEGSENSGEFARLKAEQQAVIDSVGEFIAAERRPREAPSPLPADDPRRLLDLIAAPDDLSL